ncbi:uncharacterized protein LOC127737124 [Mytilus californianus]|uniref:uncharacterized protein LOC127737124 n=1 Tax=Mytilus californianus TaxID=6549 RepID=UPI0022467168|nr:uncharacterized protein LOC127737124 [Mytilus californianus]
MTSNKGVLKSINTSFKLLTILIFFNSFCEVASQCSKANFVPICKQSSSAWIAQATDICADIDTYHCLITENYKENVDHDNKYVECCMPSETISAGHMPRYNVAKKTLQEIVCDSDYYSPRQFQSNKYREHGVAHCIHQKSKCRSEGMAIFDDSDAVSNRKCFCNYTGNYVPEFPEFLVDGVYFDERDNRCIISKKCDPLYQELNMMYKCVDVCTNRTYRPPMSLECIPYPTASTRSPDKVSLGVTKPPVATTTSTTEKQTTVIKVSPKDVGQIDIIDFVKPSLNVIRLDRCFFMIKK